MERDAGEQSRGVSRRTVMAAAAIGTVAASARSARAQTPGAEVGGFRALGYRTEGPVCIISIERSENHNVLDAAALQELPRAWQAFHSDDALKVAIFTGSGEQAFCGGIDMGAVPKSPSAYPRRDEGIRPYTSKQNKCWKPVIAAINGFVAGPGLHFLLDADICLAVPEATFSDMHLHRTGSVPIIEPIEMARRIPAGAVSRMFLLGPHDPLTAQQALQLGLISEIAPRQQLMARAMEMARQISQADLHLTMAFVESFYKARELGVTEAVNRGLIIRQLAGYRDAPFKDRDIAELAKPGSKL